MSSFEVTIELNDELRDAIVKTFGTPVNEKAMTTHYHVVEFINGCLNDYDSGPFDDDNDARIHLMNQVQAYQDEGHHVEPAGEDRYERGIYILKIEECTEKECMEGDNNG